ncbi:MAG: response regulator transcription factor [Bacteroidaceae bacterium]|jgi:DNA-binding NarL/FixJ family response regulator|nr:response regulator transcription factor [Bacteroidaceae bacterium]
MLYILADNQELTRLGVEALCRRLDGAEVLAVQSKQQLIALLERECPAAPPVVVLDFTLFDLKDVEELLMMRQRFRNVHWVLLSDELTDDFISRVSAEGSAFSLVGKQCDAYEIDQALRLAARRQRFVCNAMMEQLLSVPSRRETKIVALTKTETEILREIAQGKTTKEIAQARYSSFHTVNTHRKNIFRKLSINTAYEATRYALRAGLIDSAEYYI